MGYIKSALLVECMGYGSIGGLYGAWGVVWAIAIGYWWVVWGITLLVGCMGYSSIGGMYGVYNECSIGGLYGV